jgi:hypothetical protein
MSVINEQQQKPKVKKLYKSTAPSIKYIFKNGNVAIFIRGCYATSDETEIKELDADLAYIQEIYFDEKEPIMTPEREDPIAALKARLREEILAEEAAKIAKATNPENDFGNYESGKVNAASTSDIAPVAAGGNAVQSRLATLMKK